MTPPLLLISGILLSSITAVSSVSAASTTSASRPFWAEKSSFIEGDDLYVVGVASRLPTLEEARQKAFEHGKLELINFAQVSELEVQGLVIETQMTHEEPQPDGTVTVFRLLRVPMIRLLVLQNRLRAQGRVRDKTVQQSREELLKQQLPLTDKERQILNTYKQALERIETQSRHACRYVRPGMTRSEVKAMLGNPAGDSRESDSTWPYGNTDILFGPNGLVESIYCQRK